MPLQAALSIGLGLMIATLNVFFRDVVHVVTVALSLLFYLTPIFYDASQAEGAFRWIFVVNPFAVLVDAYRAILFHGEMPWRSLGATAGISAVVCMWGSLVYIRRRHDMIDLI